MSWGTKGDLGKDPRTALRTQEQGKELASWGLDLIDRNSVTRVPLCLSLLFPFIIFHIYSIFHPLQTSFSLFSHVHGGRMAIAAWLFGMFQQQGYNQIPRVCVSFLNSGGDYVMGPAWVPHMAAKSAPITWDSEWEADSGGEWTASSGKGVCCEPSVCIKHVDLNNLLLHHSLSTVEFKGYPMFPQEAEIVSLMSQDSLRPVYHFFPLY